MAQAFLSLSDAGKNAAWRYIAGIVLIVVFWLLGSFITGAISVSLGLVNPEAGIAGIRESPLALALSLLSFLPMLVMPFLVTRWLHGRPAGTLLGVAQRVHWGRVGSGFMLWVALYVLAALILTLAGVSRYEFNPDFGRTLPMVLVGLLLLPIQTSAEEVFFRGYLLQATGRLTRSPILLAIVNGVLFAVPHLANPEVQQGFAFAFGQWFAFGVGFTLITLRTGALDAALGVHAANNIASFALAGYRGGALPPVALFITDSPDPAIVLVILVVAMVVAFLVLGRQSASPAPTPALQS